MILNKYISLPNNWPKQKWILIEWLVLIISCLILLTVSDDVFAGSIKIPGSDSSDKLEAAGTLLRIVDTALFKWGARIFAGLSILSAGWHLKDQRFGLAVISVIGAIITGTSPMWVRNIFEIGGGSTLFSSLQSVGIHYA